MKREPFTSKQARSQSAALPQNRAASSDWTRRRWFREGARYGVLALIAAITAKVTTGKLSPESQKCINQGICRACGKFSGCGLPQALSVRAVLEGGRT